MDNPFERRLALLQRGDRPPSGAVASSIETHEALETAWASVRSVFGPAATPEHALPVMTAILSGYVRANRHQHATDSDA